MSDPLSVRGFAKRLGVSHVAVLKAIKGGRLQHSIRQNAKGHAEIVDFDLAKQEWQINAGKPTRGTRGRVLVTVTPDGDRPDTTGGPTLTEAQRLLTLERLREKRLDIEQSTGLLVKRTDVAKMLFDGDRIVRENVLNVPARIAGTLAAEMDAGRVHILLDAALRDALQATATGYRAEAARAVNE